MTTLLSMIYVKILPTADIFVWLPCIDLFSAVVKVMQGGGAWRQRHAVFVSHTAACIPANCTFLSLCLFKILPSMRPLHPLGNRT